MTLINIVWSVINSLAALLLPIMFKNHADKKLEKHISELSKEQFIHRLQFEKEFEIYKELWRAIRVLQGATGQLIPIIDFAPGDMTEDQVRKQRLIDITDSLEKVRDVIEMNKPFYSSAVYKQCAELTNISISQIVSFHYPGSDSSIYWDLAVKRVEQIKTILDNIEIAIRERIGNMGRLKLIG